MTAAAFLIAGLLLHPAASGGQQQGPSRPRPDWPCVSSPDPSYVAITEASGGQLLLLDPSEISGSAALLVLRDRHDETLFRAGGTVEEGLLSFEVPVDSAVESLLVSVSLQCLQTVEVARPSGALVQAADAGVEYHQFQAVRVLAVAQPEPGLWTIRLAGRGITSVVVEARSELALDDVQFVEQGGRPGHEGWFPRKAPPVLGRNANLRTVVSGADGPLTIAIERQQMTTVDRQPVTIVTDESDGVDRELIGEVAPRFAAFRVVVTGRDARGYPFRRVHPQLFQATR